MGLRGNGTRKHVIVVGIFEDDKIGVENGAHDLARRAPLGTHRVQLLRNLFRRHGRFFHRCHVVHGVEQLVGFTCLQVFTRYPRHRLAGCCSDLLLLQFPN